MAHDAGDPLATVNVPRDDIVRIGRVLRLVEKLSREILNHTPLSSGGLQSPRTVEMLHDGKPDAVESAVWPVEVTADPPGGSTELSELSRGTIYVPDPTVDPPWVSLACWVRPLPGTTLAVGDIGIARLVGWRDADGTYDGMPVYAMSSGGSGGGGTTSTCLDAGWLAGMGATRCLRVTVNGTATVLYLSTTDGLTWTSADLLTICEVDYTVTVTRNAGGMPTLTLTGVGSGAPSYSGQWKCAGCAFVKWDFNLQDLCPDEADTGDPCTNVVEIRVSNAACAPAGTTSCTDPASEFEFGQRLEDTTGGELYWHINVISGHTYHVTSSITGILYSFTGTVNNPNCVTVVTGDTEWAYSQGSPAPACFEFTPIVSGCLCIRIAGGAIGSHFTVNEGPCP